MKKLLLLLFILSLYLASSLSADCIYNGKSYPTGTILGPLVCGEDGQWHPR